MLMLDRRTLLRAGSAAVGAAALVPTAPALARAPVDRVRCSRSAARRDPPHSVTATKARSSSKSSMALIVEHDH
jgi:hypothetical protein